MALSYWKSELSDKVEPAIVKGLKTSAVIGCDGIKISDTEVDIVSLCLNHARALARYSCGQCIPCRIGTKALADLFERLRGSRDKESILNAISGLSDTISSASLCELGKSVSVFSRMLKNLRGHFREALKKTGTLGKALNYKSYLTAPCMEACPIHLDIPRYVEAVKNRQYREGLNVILQRLPLPGVLGRVCVRPCEFNCRRTLIDEPIQIRHIKRFLADSGINPHKVCASTPELSRNYQLPKRQQGNGIKTAVVGAGPAGLTCAYLSCSHGI